VSPRAAGDSTHYKFACIDRSRLDEAIELGIVVGDPYDFVSVTTVIKAALDKSGPLTGWAENQAIASMKLLAEKGYDITAYSDEQLKGLMKDLSLTSHQKRAIAGTRGTQAHNVLEVLAEKGIRAGKKELANVDPAFQGYAQSAIKWWEEERPKKIIFSEKPLISLRWRYAGTADICYVDQEDRIVLADAKTSKGFYIELDTQLGAYALALKEHGITVDRYLGLKLTEEGEHLTKDSAAPEPKDRLVPKPELFLACLAVYRTMRVKEGKFMSAEDRQMLIDNALSVEDYVEKEDAA
jgi:hypothetical protein